MLITQITPLRGLVRVSGVVPNGPLTVQRTAPGYAPYTIRGGSLTITTEGFSLEDSEAQLGVPLTYTAISKPLTANRVVQRNFVITPEFTRSTGSWTAGTPRVLTRTLDSSVGRTVGQVTPNEAGTSSGIAGRTIAEVGLNGLLPSTQYLINGRIKFRTPDVWSFQDMKSFGTWQAVKTAKATWQAVKTSSVDPAALNAFATVYLSLVNGATTYVAPLQVINTSLGSSGQWTQFSAILTTPANMPAIARLRVLHGTNTREYAITWQLDQFGMQLQSNAVKPYFLLWFSGSSAVPTRPQDYLMQDSTWDALTSDASMTWEDVPDNSISRFTVPSQISTSAKCQIEIPENEVPCTPVLLSDPVAGALGQWFGLGPMNTLSRAARANILSVINRGDYIAESGKRGWETGTLTLFTETITQRNQANAILDSGRVLLLRNPDESYPENNWYIAILDVDEDRTLPDGRRPERTWSVPFVRVKRPSGLIEASTGTNWKQIRDSGQTWLEVRSTRDNWLGLIVEPA